jgi:selenocysteine-specific translation elongation factor
MEVATDGNKSDWRFPAVFALFGIATFCIAVGAVDRLTKTHESAVRTNKRFAEELDECREMILGMHHSFDAGRIERLQGRIEAIESRLERRRIGEEPQ